MIAWAAIFIPLAKLNLDFGGDIASIAGWMVAIIAYFSSLYYLRTGNNIFVMVFQLLENYRDAKESTGDDQLDLYNRAESEYENGEFDKGLWSKALVNANGDESLRKTEYMKLRVRQLKKQSKNR